MDKDLVANLAVFPVVIGLLMFGRVIFDNFGGDPNTSQFSPPLIGRIGGTDSIAPLIALGIILMLPHIAESVKKTIKEGKFASPGGAIGAGIAAGTALVVNTPRRIQGIRSTAEEPAVRGVNPATGQIMYGGKKGLRKAILGRFVK